MKAVFAITVLFMYSSNIFAIEFNSFSIEESIKRAKTENKNILVSYSASWCLPCTVMKSSVFQDIEINNMVANEWIAVSVDFDNDHHAEWIHAYEVKCLPTHLIIDKEGIIIARTEGGMSIAQFKSFLINKTTLNFEHIAPPIQKLSLNNTVVIQPEPNLNNTYGKIIVDGILVDIDSPVNPETYEVKNGIENNVLYTENLQNEFVLQLGAFSSLDKVKKHQQNINSNLKEQTIIIVDFKTEKLPYKLITKNRYNEVRAINLAQNWKAIGVDCFVRSL